MRVYLHGRMIQNSWSVKSKARTKLSEKSRKLKLAKDKQRKQYKK